MKIIKQILNRYTAFLLIIFTIVIAQQVEENIRYDAWTGKKYKIIKSKFYDPNTGNLITKSDTIFIEESDIKIEISEESAVPDVAKNIMAFDPLTGLEVQRNDLTIISLARANAKKDFNKVPWMVLGGPSTCGSMILGATLGSAIMGTPGFIIGTVSMGIITPKIISNTSPQSGIIYPELVTYQEQALYNEHYIKQTKILRENSVYSGVMATCGATAIVGFLMIAGFVSGF